MNKPRILIVGAGISGLALTKALVDLGFPVEVVERRSNEDPALGTGIYLPANAVRALRAIGLEEDLATHAKPVVRQRLEDHRGRPLTEFTVDRIWGEVGPCMATTRRDLHDLLHAMVDSDAVRYNTEVIAVTDEGAVTFADGTTSTYDLVVGADGINSAVRKSQFPGSSPRFLGQLCWRFIADDTAIPGITDWTARLGAKGRTFLTVQLGAGRVYCYADINSPAFTAPAGDWRTLFVDFGGPVPQLLEQGAAAHFAALYESRNTAWTRARTVLIGDAAHTLSPSMAQGGAMALEDAVVLADILERTPDVATALAAFQDRRAKRVAWVSAQNQRRDKARNLPGPLRNITLRHAGERLFKSNHAPLHDQP
ncbi:FAD-dependent monooxygenase [Streptomyces sp. NPDC026673]|uniref:FAD-dependent monooxygenase n=1 Tax=Streptomyces sp. NPDC026673 TaxID=3155724 RepID=UPI0033C61A73